MTENVTPVEQATETQKSEVQTPVAAQPVSEPAGSLPEKTPLWKKWWFLLIIVVIAGIVWTLM